MLLVVISSNKRDARLGITEGILETEAMPEIKVTEATLTATTANATLVAAMAANVALAIEQRVQYNIALVIMEATTVRALKVVVLEEGIKPVVVALEEADTNLVAVVAEAVVVVAVDIVVVEVGIGDKK